MCDCKQENPTWKAQGRLPTLGPVSLCVSRTLPRMTLLPPLEETLYLTAASPGIPFTIHQPGLEFLSLLALFR